MKMQEQGLQTGGFIQGVLGNISNRYQGNDQYGMLALKERLGLSYSATEQLYQNRQSIMSGQMTDSQIEEMSRGGVIAEARRNTSGLDKSAAQITDEFASNLGTANGTLTIFEKTLSELVETITTAKDAFMDFNMAGSNLMRLLGFNQISKPTP
jgi:hypothetical protein